VGAAALTGAVVLGATGLVASRSGDMGTVPPVAVPPAAAPTTGPTAKATSPRGAVGPGETRSGIALPTGEIGTSNARLEDQPLRAPAVPTRLRVAALGVDAPVQAVGVGPDGELAVPSSAGSLAWWRDGAGPGDPGSAVLAGHVDYRGKQGVFFSLRSLAVGSSVEVTYADGGKRPFTVVARRQVAKSALPTEDLFAASGKPRLVLITCGGEFDDTRRSYRDNVVVYAVPA